MPPGLPHRPPLAMRFWLSRRFGRNGGKRSALAAFGRASGKSMGIESLEHMVRSRVRMFLHHTWLVAVLGTLILVGVLWAGFYFTTQADRVRIAAGPPDSKFVQALSAQVAKSHHNLHLQFVSVNGTTAMAEAMAKGQVDLAVLPSTADNSLDWPVVAILRQNVMVLIVPAPGAANKSKSGGSATTAKRGKSAGKGKSAKGSKGAKSAKSDDSDAGDDSDKFGKVSQLAGKRVGIVTGNEATADLLDLALNHYGVPPSKVTVSEIDPKNLADAVKSNQVDVLFVAGAAAGKAISAAVAAATQNGTAPGFIEIDQADGIAKRNPAFDSVDIDAGTFGGIPPTPDDSLTSLSFAQYLVARKSFSDSVINTLAKTIYSSRQALAAAMPGEIKIAAPSTDKDAAVLVHPGTLAYLSDSQQSFFDKYGDDIFYGMLIFPVFGSAVAAVAGYMRSDTRTRRLRLLQRVLDLVRKAHTAQTLETLDHLQIDADDLVIAIIHQSEHEEFDETVRMSFAFALDQLRFAIAARRTAILDRTGTDANTAAPTGAQAAAA